MLICFVSLSGCKKSSEPEPGPSGDEVTSAAEYEAEAEKEINKENVEAELDKLEKELEEDISSEQ